MTHHNQTKKLTTGFLTGEEGERGPCTAVGSAGLPVAAPGRWARAAALLPEQGRVVARGR
jgi:hypothetical protein